MRSSLAKLAAAAVVISVAGIGLIGTWRNGAQVAYAFEQTVLAMQGKQSFHIKTYSGSPSRCKDEFWAQFDEDGKLFWSRQEEWNGREEVDGPRQVTIWQDNTRDRYYPEAHIELITRIGNAEDGEDEHQEVGALPQQESPSVEAPGGRRGFIQPRLCHRSIPADRRMARVVPVIEDGDLSEVLARRKK